MKKFTTLLTMAFIALMSISFTSCDVDADNGNRAYFELYRDYDSYNWRDYDWGYDWDYDDGWGYSKQHSGLENTQIVSRGAKDSVEYVKVADDNQKPVRRFVVK